MLTYSFYTPYPPSKMQINRPFFLIEQSVQPEGGEPCFDEDTTGKLQLFIEGSYSNPAIIQYIRSQ